MISAVRSAQSGKEVAAEPSCWQKYAACGGVEAAVFFSPEGERGNARSRRELQARRICQTCPVLGQCREYALGAGELYGTWGGMSEADRRRHAQ
ncbi:WhiB family transcriptional regulator [Rhodococcus sp. (in: high G+C Gram-positive bacteria)]|uniref:Transcriptional regulator WhiB n=1 Tax=Rhodococcus baikonurensis TaxID=172041 RepID=A0ABV5XEP7_9NOCA